MSKRYDANVNITIEVPDEDMLFQEAGAFDDNDEDDMTVEQALSNLLESEQPTFEIGLSGASAFIVAAERVTYLDG